MKDAQADELIDKLADIGDAIVDSYDKYLAARIPVDALAADVFEKTIFKAPFDCIVKDVVVIPDGNIGQATNYMTLDIQNKGAAGSGTTSLGSRNVNGSNTITGFIGVDLVSTDAAVTEGHCLTIKKTKNGDGQIFPGGLVVVKYEKA